MSSKNLVDVFLSRAVKTSTEATQREAYEAILKALEGQQGLFDDYKEEVAERTAAYIEAEDDYQRRRKIYNSRNKGKQAWDGAVFVLETAFLGDIKCVKPVKSHYEPSRSQFISLDKISAYECVILQNLKKLFDDQVDKGIAVFYRDLPAFVDAGIAGAISPGRKDGISYPVFLNEDQQMLETGSVMIKMTNAGLIAAQIKTIKEMQSSPDPLNPRKPGFFKRIFGR